MNFCFYHNDVSDNVEIQKWSFLQGQVGSQPSTRAGAPCLFPSKVVVRRNSSDDPQFNHVEHATHIIPYPHLVHHASWPQYKLIYAESFEYFVNARDCGHRLHDVRNVELLGSFSIEACTQGNKKLRRM